MGKYINQLNDYILSDPTSHNSNTDTDNTDTLHKVNNVHTVSSLHNVSKVSGSTSPTKEKYTYVRCSDCNNFEAGNCKAWGHKPDFPDNEVRLCGKYLEKIDE